MIKELLYLVIDNPVEEPPSICVYIYIYIYISFFLTSKGKELRNRVYFKFHIVCVWKKKLYLCNF